MAGAQELRDATAAIDGWAALPTALLEREVATEHAEGARAPSKASVRTAEKAFAAALEEDGPFAAIVASAELDESSARVLALCAAVETDRRLQRLVGLLVHDAHAYRVDVDLLERLLGPDAVDCLADDAPLSRAALAELEPGVPLAAAGIVIPRRVLWALRDDPSLDPGLPAGCQVVAAPPGAIGTAQLALVHGEDRVRRLQSALVTTTGLLFLVTLPPADEAAWQVLVRQATVLGAGVVLEVDDTLSPLAKRWVDRADHLAFAVCSPAPLAVEGLPDRPFVELTADAAEVSDMEWGAVFPGSTAPGRRPPAEQLRLARAVARPGDEPAVAIRRVASGTLLKHATRVVPHVGWDELVLPPVQERQLRALVDRYQQRGKVHEDWGLPLFPSPGVVALFSGPSGTGKTTTAEVIAGELGVDMFRVDLSALVSKYIGETEKNLEQIFSAAHAGDYLLLFDEADSLFGSRSKVSDSRDRYANLEVSYLLQRLETYDGFVVLTSNFQGNIDPAFLRRIHLTVHFPVPSAGDRQRIWERSLGGAPVQDLELDFVAEQFDLTGGSIRNAALTAAFAAAAAHRPIGMAELLRAVAQEMTKLGRRPNDAQFGRWLDQVADVSDPAG